MATSKRVKAIAKKLMKQKSSSKTDKMLAKSALKQPTQKQ